MDVSTLPSRLPRHVGLIPDGNRRWAKHRGLHPRDGYAEGVRSGLRMLDDCLGLGIEEVSVYGFTTDNNKRPIDQRKGFMTACAAFAERALTRDISLRVIGDVQSPCFPDVMRPLAMKPHGSGRLRVNMLVNYGWKWDLQSAIYQAVESGKCGPMTELMGSADVSRIDLVVRWGAMRRLSGFLPLQTVYADFFVVDDLWPDYQLPQFLRALEWYSLQDPTLGG